MDIKILFVDDEPHILNALRRGLVYEEYECFFAENGEAALKILEQQKICIIVTDMRMPEMDGLALLKIVKEKYPDIIKIVLSGYTQLPQILATINQVDVFKFITKPWKMEEEFKGIIAKAIEYYQVLEERKVLKEELERKNAAYKNMMNKLDVIAREAQRESKHFHEVTDLVFSAIHNHLAAAAGKEDVSAFFAFAFAAYQEYTKLYPFTRAEFLLEDFWHEAAQTMRHAPQVADAGVMAKLKIPCRVMQSAGALEFALALIQKAIFHQAKYYVRIVLEEKVHVGENKIIECSLVFSPAGETKGEEHFLQFCQGFLSEFLGAVLKHIDITFSLTKVKENHVARFQLKSKDRL